MAGKQHNDNARRFDFDDEYIEDVAARYSQRRKAGDDVNIALEVADFPEEGRPALLAKLLVTEQGWLRWDDQPLLTYLQYLQANPSLASLLPAAYAALPEHLYIPSKLGKYVIERHIRSGTQGNLVLAVHEQDKKLHKTPYVIKYTTGNRAIGSLKNERDLLRKLPKGIALQTFHVAIDTQGSVKRGYLVLEYLSGSSLRAKGEQIRGDFLAAAAITSQLAKSMQVLHSLSIAHRDVKPENILADANGKYRFIDFGHACEFESFAGGERKVLDHSGTYRYMSPQQQSQRLDENRVSSDIYALGGVLYFLLTGKNPSAPYTKSQCAAKDFDKPWRTDIWDYEQCPLHLRDICLRAMRTEEKRRYPSAAAFADELDRWLFRRRLRRRMVAAGAACLLLIGAGLAVALGAISDAPPPLSPPSPLSTNVDAPAPAAQVQTSWISTLLHEHGVSEGDITRDSFDVSFELDPRDADYSPSKPVYLRVNLNGLPEDLLAGVEYRFGKRAWSNLSGWTIAGSYRALISPELHSSEEPLQIQLDSVREYQQGQTIGPFTYDIDIREEMQKHARARAEEFAKATSGKWLMKQGDTWFFTQSFLDKHLPHIHMLWGGTSPEALQPYHHNAWRSPGAMRTQATFFLKNLQQTFSFRQSRETGEPKFYLQLEGHDGQKSEVRSFLLLRNKIEEPRVPAGGVLGGGGVR